MDTEIQVLLEKDDWVVLNKPAGLVVHADGRTTEPTLVDWLLERYPDLVGVGESMFVKNGEVEVEIARPGIVHRLDRDTSGVIVIARNQPAFDVLKKKFQDREIQKTYLAFVYGQPKKDEGTVDAPIGRSPKDFRRWSAQPGARGMLREALTDWRMLARMGDVSSKSFSLLEFQPHTGRTHQIRVHAKYMHHPIVSDPLYAGKRKPALGFKRQALHARRIVFEWKGEDITIEAPLPADFEVALQQNNISLTALEK